MITVGRVYKVKPESAKPWRENSLTVEKVEGVYIGFDGVDSMYHKDLLNDHYDLVPKDSMEKTDES